MTPEQLAQIAYEAWCAKVYRPPVPPYQWHQLDEHVRQGWRAAAQAVKANVMANFTHVGETHA